MVHSHLVWFRASESEHQRLHHVLICVPRFHHKKPVQQVEEEYLEFLSFKELKVLWCSSVWTETPEDKKKGMSWCMKKKRRRFSSTERRLVLGPAPPGGTEEKRTLGRALISKSHRLRWSASTARVGLRRRGPERPVDSGDEAERRSDHRRNLPLTGDQSPALQSSSAVVVTSQSAVVVTSQSAVVVRRFVLLAHGPDRTGPAAHGRFHSSSRWQQAAARSPLRRVVINPIGDLESSQEQEREEGFATGRRGRPSAPRGPVSGLFPLDASRKRRWRPAEDEEEETRPENNNKHRGSARKNPQNNAVTHTSSTVVVLKPETSSPPSCDPASSLSLHLSSFTEASLFSFSEKHFEQLLKSERAPSVRLTSITPPPHVWMLLRAPTEQTPPQRALIHTGSDLRQRLRRVGCFSHDSPSGWKLVAPTLMMDQSIKEEMNPRLSINQPVPPPQRQSAGGAVRSIKLPGVSAGCRQVRGQRYNVDEQLPMNEVSVCVLQSAADWTPPCVLTRSHQ
ncbi:unnamed protein product [Pleuronectes platessa]|uniref:Uncharacterized protein n=1 Tax=Pleuronectes platessa TaxID=8262 RepID=A0A9N7YKH6_PLEPL|nr:unnamed protein product [Pleuronectes platessa]